MILFQLCFIAISFSFLSAHQADTLLVKNVQEFEAAVESLEPGDEIVLANGIWKDAELKFMGKGTSDKPIRLTVEEKGKVTLEGQSNLRMSGEYLVVEGLVFKNGYTPTSEVISTRTSKDDLCNHCRVTECVIDNYNPPERFESDYWIGIYGRHNRIDHNYLVGKRNQGVTMAVRLNTEESRANYHRIDHNYFGHHPILGSNGGETLRIGTSHHSLTNSNTLVESNFFDRCNGEHEIISNKSCQNIFRNNTFYECQGTLTMRHGNETLVENNYFFGNGKPNTGGVRIINETQTVRNNYHEGLTGYRFRGALVIMNGVPNSPLNRYFQVIDSEASYNTYINCDHIQLCAGSDEERSATPQNSTIANNIFWNESKEDLFTVYDDISGITFSDNLLSPNMKPFQDKGFSTKDIKWERDESGLMVPVENIEAGFQPKGERATPQNTGVSWYSVEEQEQFFNTGKMIKVSAGENTLFEAVKNSSGGDIIQLQDTGEYLLTKSIDVTHPITVLSKSDLPAKPVLKFQKTSLFNIENGGALSLRGLAFSGTESRDKPGNSVVRTSRYSMINNYKFFVEDCDFRDLDINHSFEVLKVYKNTFADSIVIRNSTFSRVSGSVLSLNKETDDIGVYNAENVIIENCQFREIGGAVLNLHRGGRDESTFGPMLKITESTFEDIGHNQRAGSPASIHLHGVQIAEIENNQFVNSKPVKLHMVVGEPITRVVNCTFVNTPAIEANDEPYYTENLTYK